MQGHGYVQWEFSALKKIRLTESKQRKFRAEFFNLFNQSNIRLPDHDINSPTFGQIQKALPPRLTQFGPKLLF